MTYLISKSFEYQKVERVEFIREITKLPLYPKNGVLEDFYYYQTFPFKPKPNICLVIGHNNEVADLLHNHLNIICEENIFIISCAINYIKDYDVPDKNIFLCDQMSDNQVRFRNGKDFGLNFHATDAELYLAQSDEPDILMRFKSCFNEIYHNAKE